MQSTVADARTSKSAAVIGEYSGMTMPSKVKSITVHSGIELPKYSVLLIWLPDLTGTYQPAFINGIVVFAGLHDTKFTVALELIVSCK